MQAKLFLGPANGKIVDYNPAFPELKFRIKRRQARNVWVPNDLDQLVVTYRKVTEVNGTMYFGFVGFDHDPAPSMKVL